MDETLNINGHSYESWPDFFKKSFERSGKYRRVDIGEKGDTFGEQYVPVDSHNKTVISVRYFKLSEALIELTFDNPLTPGYSKMQATEYFYKYDFTPDESYGPPGLEFIEINVKAIDKQLRQGIKGKEEQFFENGKLVRSKVYLDYDGKSDPYGWTADFDKKPFLKRLKNLFSKSDNTPDATTEIVDLSIVFSGL